jgi:integrase/transposase
MKPLTKKRRPNFTDEQRANLLHQAALMRARGKRMGAIADHLKLHYSTLYSLIRRYREEWNDAYTSAVELVGEVPHHYRETPAPESIDTAARLHAEGKTPEEIAEHFGVTATTIQGWRCYHRQRWDTAYLSAAQPFGPPPKPPTVPHDPSRPARTLWSLAEMMFGRKANIRSGKTIKHYRYSINCFGKYLERVPTEADLSDDTLTAWLAELQRKVDSVSTARSYVERVRALWRFLNDRGEITTRPTFTLPPIPEPQPIALDTPELRQLFESAMCRPGLICGIPARHWWSALFGFAFCTSERKGAIMALRWEWVSLDSGAVSIPAAVRKGGLKNATYCLWPEAVALLKRIVEPRRELVFPWDRSEATFYHRLGKIYLDARLPDDRKHKLHALRVSHNTWTRVLTGEQSPLLLHSDHSVSERHYEDKRYTVREAVKLQIPWQVPRPMAAADESTSVSSSVVAVKVNGKAAAKLPRGRLVKGGVA